MSYVKNLRFNPQIYIIIHIHIFGNGFILPVGKCTMEPQLHEFSLLVSRWLQPIIIKNLCKLVYALILNQHAGDRADKDN